MRMSPVVFVSCLLLLASPGCSDDGPDPGPSETSTTSSSTGESSTGESSTEDSTSGGGSECFPDQTACGDDCCDVTEVCEDNVCVSESTSGGSECAPDQSECGEECCNVNEVCEDNVCVGESTT